jgi:hypothetical protein
MALNSSSGFFDPSFLSFESQVIGRTAVRASLCRIRAHDR